MAATGNPRARRQTRHVIVQALYQSQVNGTDAQALEKQFLESGSLDKGDQVYFHELLRGVLNNVESLDAIYEGVLDRKISDLNYVERGILRAGCYEMKERLEIPYRVVISEWVRLAKSFGAEESHKYINGVLDKLAAQLRKLEVQAR